MIRPFFLLICLIGPFAARAEVPRVVVDVAPVHSLVAQIMGDAGAPSLLLPPGADPHDFAFRPSDAAMLANANLIIAVGPALTPWLTDTITSIAPDTPLILLGNQEDWPQLATRGDGHSGGIDPHGWLDSTIAQIWAGHIAAALIDADPAGADIYRANLAQTVDGLAALDVKLTEKMQPLADELILWPHDGYQYFEVRYGLSSVGSIAITDGHSPGPTHIASLRDRATAGDISCILSDAAVSDAMAQLVAEGTQVPVRQIDNTGRDLEVGPMLYAAMLNRLADALVGCIAG